ncbi:rRNA maturation RNase YbeY [Candidatus Gottesmanbacteria bacterium RIFCSPLOWO2_01_FULL_49_10]|uniref:rRNA maturation RNase YbeY n=1 Tax=Candidatus Gottesmanbacteria bacterium RIFCSPLOWO2_01_FULL_49_10 TaxID=1798396 RepID=A0A1F6B187_9BACT|nr:MAG: rRNA maturation RNase YbeY [Candidatus Gottesmanbacteria bacterium RIFCSPLOWO2_01_FULL_49_10]
MITVLFQTETHYPVNRKTIKEAVVAALSRKIKHQVEVSISIIGDRRMRQLNRDYRKIDETTDVLSFPLNDPSSPSTLFVELPDSILRLGDILVSYPQAVTQATEENKMVDDVIVELVLHGLDHLLGIHHEE